MQFRSSQQLLSVGTLSISFPEREKCSVRKNSKTEKKTGTDKTETGNHEKN